MRQRGLDNGASVGMYHIGLNSFNIMLRYILGIRYKTLPVPSGFNNASEPRVKQSCYTRTQIERNSSLVEVVGPHAKGVR